MINFDDYVNEKKTKCNENWSYIPNHPYRILTIGGSGSGKTNVLINLIENQPDIDKIYLYAKDAYEAKHQYLIKILEKVGIVHHKILQLILSIQMKRTTFTKILIIKVLINKIKY